MYNSRDMCENSFSHMSSRCSVMLLYYVLITLPCPTIARWTVGFKCCTYCEYKITIMLPSLVQLYTEPSNATWWQRCSRLSRSNLTIIENKISRLSRSNPTIFEDKSLGSPGVTSLFSKTKSLGSPRAIPSTAKLSHSQDWSRLLSVRQVLLSSLNLCFLNYYTLNNLTASHDGKTSTRIVPSRAIFLQ